MPTGPNAERRTGDKIGAAIARGESRLARRCIALNWNFGRIGSFSTMSLRNWLYRGALLAFSSGRHCSQFYIDATRSQKGRSAR